ncbi:uncharacterized protein TNCV_862721 [Trichonephila clavipes]|nr:uncharacterized protein TNCV_862721 [Trichonephila clavipes]
MHMGKDQLFKIAISGYRTSVENVELSPPFQHNATPNDNCWTTIVGSFRNVTGMKPCSDLSPNQLAWRIACGVETTLINEEDLTPLIRCPIFVFLTQL